MQAARYFGTEARAWSGNKYSNTGELCLHMDQEEALPGVGSSETLDEMSKHFTKYR